ncbi:MAG: GNAT family N-acetyltransferase [Ferruginibacter sp.]
MSSSLPLNPAEPDIQTEDRAIVVHKVGAESIPVIQSLAKITWEVVYKEILSEAQLIYMLELIYSSDSLQHQIEELGHQFILVTVEEKEAGFASYSRKNENACTIYILHKIYIDPNHHGKGIGKILLNYIVDDIIPAGAKSLELNVNRHNKALGFYKKSGFEIIDEQDIPIGRGYFMNDYIMKLSW